MVVGVTMSDPVGALVTGPLIDVLPNTTLRGAAGVLADEMVGALVVEDAVGVKGIISERDIVRALAEGFDPDSNRVGEVMADDLLTVDAATSLADAAQAMAVNEVRHLLVVRDDEVVGVVSMRDVLGVVLSEREQDELPAGASTPDPRAVTFMEP